MYCLCYLQTVSIITATFTEMINLLLFDALKVRLFHIVMSAQKLTFTGKKHPSFEIDE